MSKKFCWKFFFLFLRLKKVELEGINLLINNFNGIFQFFFFLLRLYYLSLKENFKDSFFLRYYFISVIMKCLLLNLEK